jgi:hypothetical protein
MIPILLWRCPICQVNDALEDKKRIFRPWHLHCTNCDTVWQVKRVVGEDFQLKVLSSPSHQDEVGTELPLAQWYTRLKETLTLTAIEDPEFELAQGERLYLASRPVLLRVLSSDPFFFPPEQGGDDRDQPVGKEVGMGRIFLTDRRVVWHGEDGKVQDFSLSKINSFFTIFNIGGVLMHETSIYDIRFKQESLLKWVTYFGLVAKEVKQTMGHVITTSKY